MTSTTFERIVTALPVDAWARRLAGVRRVLLSAADHACLWLIEAPELADKYRLATLVWDFNWSADALGGRLVQLRLDEDALERREALADDVALLAPLTAAARNDRTRVLDEQVVPALSQLVRELRDSCDLLFDEGTYQCLNQILQRLGQPATELDTAAAQRETDGEFVPVPGVSVPDDLEPARPAAHPPTEGYEWPSWKESLPEFMHAVAFGIEICAAEVCAMAIVSHPDLPAGLRVDLARQVSDEMRHCYMLLNRAAELGVEPFSIPYDVEVWDQLRPAETLLDRLTLEQRIGEGHGLDDTANMRDQFVARGDWRTAAVFDFITADEVIHVRSGNRWIRTLLDDSQDRVDAQESSVRAKSAALGMPVRPTPAYLNLPLRRMAGFTEQELDRLVDSLADRS